MPRFKNKLSTGWVIGYPPYQKTKSALQCKQSEEEEDGEKQNKDEQGKEKEKGEKITTSTPTRERKQDQAKNKLEKMTLASFM